jgi:uncharacterized protein (DUF305 family)
MSHSRSALCATVAAALIGAGTCFPATSGEASLLSENAAAMNKMMAAPARAGASQEAAFLAENQAAMDKMMAGMNVKPTGDVDHDFAAMMIPHHQGAIDMAQAELQYGRNQKLLRIAQEIVVEQLQEIAAMRLAIGERASPTWVTNEAHDAPAVPLSHKANPGDDAPFVSRSNAAMDKMMADMAVEPTGDVDHDFVAMMVPHHQGAIEHRPQRERHFCLRDDRRPERGEGLPHRRFLARRNHSRGRAAAWSLAIG